MHYSKLNIIVAVFSLPLTFCMEIEPNETELVYTKNSTIILTCLHNSSVQWDYERHEGSSSNITVTISENNEIFESRLSIQNAHYLDTNYYACVHIKEGEPIISKSIYIYVSDPDNLIALQNEEVPVILTVTEFENTTIPCKPTSPDVQVTLKNDVEEVITHLTYDPKKGFLIMSPSDVGYYICTGTANILNKTKSNSIDLHIFFSPVDETAQPYINASDADHPVEGSTIVLNCSVIIKHGSLVFIKWLLPDDNLKKKAIEGGQLAFTIENETVIRKINYKMLTIPNVTRYDQGNYICEVTDLKQQIRTARHYLNIYKPDETFLYMELPSTNEITIKAGEPNVQWIVNITAYPHPLVNCLTPSMKLIDSSNSLINNKYILTFNNKLAKFVINKIDIRDAGKYVLTAHNEHHSKHIDLILHVQDKPEVNITNEFVYYNFGENYQIECGVIGYPIPDILWYSKICNEYPACEGKTFNPIEKNSLFETDISPWRKSTLSFHANESVVLLCNASNEFGSSNSSSVVLVTEIPNGLSVTVNSSEITVGDNISVACYVSKYSYNNNITWFFNDTKINNLIPVNDTDEIQIKNENTRFSYMSTLNITNIQKNNSGQYICQVIPVIKDHQKVYRLVDIDVKDIEKPTIVYTNMNNSITKVKSETNLKMECSVTGMPKPSIKWLKDGKSLPKNNSRIILLENNQILSFNYVSMHDDGKYTCTAVNKGGSSAVFTTLQLIDKPEEHEHWDFILAGSILAVVCVISIICLSFKTQKEKKLRKKLAEDGLLNFEEGAINSLNPDISVEDQADLLPYDRRWEFPRDKLKMGKQLGSGAFGVVMKAEADGIIDPNTRTTVAVKMVKREVDPLYIRALASELKIMVHLGRHLNVVNLLGACTRNINKRELIVIVEYCKYGNLHDFLLKQRNNFINQIVEDQLDFSIIDANKKTYQNSVIINGSFTGNSNSESATVEETQIGSDGYLINKDAEPDWRSNYRGDYRNTIIKPIKTSDLLCWSFQISRGMEYLASRKVLHGDLAARNVLLADDNIVKICDFGLAKSMYNSENYKRRKHELLPVRWMAIESIRDRVFSIQSDVWSFGITMWELFSLSVTPYPGVEHLDTLYSKLEDGYRLEKPTYATKEIHDIMLDCWQERPILRPTFTELSERLGMLLEIEVKSHYTNLNEMYVQMNANMNSSVDYLALLNPPSYIDGEESRYVNVLSRESPESEEDVELKPMLFTSDNNYINQEPISFLNLSYIDVNKAKKLTYVNIDH